jgi:hypothetical protein
MAPPPPAPRLPLDLSAPEPCLPCSLHYSPPFPILLPLPSPFSLNPTTDSCFVVCRWSKTTAIAITTRESRAHEGPHREGEGRDPSTSRARRRRLGASSGGRRERSTWSCRPSCAGRVSRILAGQLGHQGARNHRVGPPWHRTNKRQEWVSCPPCSISGSPHARAPK